jgi:hypothetical protein
LEKRLAKRVGRRAERHGGWCALAAVAWMVWITPVCAGQFTAATHEHIRVVPDTEGAIDEVVLHYIPDVASELRSLYRTLLRALPEDVRIRVVCPGETAENGFRNVWATLVGTAGRHVTVTRVEGPITLWSRDRIIARQGARTSRPAPPFVPLGFDDGEGEKANEIRMIPPRLWGSRGQHRPTTGVLRMEGGNVVSNRRHAFVGANVLTDNADLGVSDRRLAREVSRTLGVTVVFMGDAAGEVPYDHVDMYLTPLDDGTVLVGCTRSARAFVTSRRTRRLSRSAAGWVYEEMDVSEETADLLDTIAAQVETLGYEVVRTPLIIDAEREWVVTYNNVVLDRRLGRNTVYLPMYRIPFLDRAGEDVYRRLGLEVRKIDVSGIFDLGGAVRCVVNVTRRRSAVTDRAVGRPDWDGRVSGGGSTTQAGTYGYERMTVGVFPEEVRP